MKIIGAGFGRTGTMSLRAALIELGFDPCYHMLEVFKHPAHIQKWLAAAQGESVDWQAFLGSFQAGVDYPLSAFYRELMAVYPEAKVILTVRDPERWYESTRETIYQGTAVPEWLLGLLPPFRNMKRMVNAAIWERIFAGRFEDRDYAIRVFEEHIATVQAHVPPERLLTYHVKDGWAPLCEFLGLPIPDRPFPHINQRRTTKGMYLVARIAGASMAVGLILLLIWLTMLIV